jgi:hypothetical protein
MSALQPGAFVRFVYDDGGRAAAGFKGRTGDCACRAIAIATGKSYREVHDGLNAFCALFGDQFGEPQLLRGRQRQRRTSADSGVSEIIAQFYLGQLGWRWNSMNKARLRRWDLPAGRLIVQVTQHLVAVIDHVVHDHGEHWRGRRLVYGYFIKPPNAPQATEVSHGQA